MPLAPLIEDLQRYQKAARLKPEALERELSLDLRSESGLYRSTLLHRLNVLGVPWGRLTDAGRSRGTFRERWTLAWEPEYAVRLVENLVYGPTIEKAANGRLIQMIGAAATLDALADWSRARSPPICRGRRPPALRRWRQRAALSSDCLEMLASVPPLADIIRYGEARKTDAGPAVRSAGAADRRRRRSRCRYAARDLDAAGGGGAGRRACARPTRHQAGRARRRRAGRLAQRAADVLDESRSTALVAGCAAHLLYEAGQLAAEDAAELLERRLSPGTPVTDAAGFFEGFFSGAGQRLIYDEASARRGRCLAETLDEDAFIAHLPLLRRVFSNLDSMERRRLIEAVLGRAGAAAGRR